MIQIDKTDKLYKYLSDLNVEDIDSLYTELATNGRVEPKDIRAYLYADFDISDDEFDLDDEAGIVLDYYNDIKKYKPLTKKTLKEKLNEYQISCDKTLKEDIIHSILSEVFYLSVCYKANHKDIDLMDIIQNSNIGAIKAIEKYKPTRLTFDDYLMFYIREQLNNTFKEENNG